MMLVELNENNDLNVGLFIYLARLTLAYNQGYLHSHG